MKAKETLNLTGLRLYWISLVASLFVGLSKYIPWLAVQVVLYAGVFALSFTAIFMLSAINDTFRNVRNLFLWNNGLIVLLFVMRIVFPLLPEGSNFLNIIQVTSFLLGLLSYILSFIVLITIMKATADLCSLYKVGELADKINRLRKNMPKAIYIVLGSIAVTAVSFALPFLLPLVDGILMLCLLWLVVMTVQWIYYTGQVYRHLHNQPVRKIKQNK